MEALKNKILSKTVLDDNGCMVWKGNCVANYSSVTLNKFEKAALARSGIVFENLIYGHRLIYCLHNKVGLTPIDTICHTCDNRLCLNPDHLKLGTKAVNNRHRCLNKLSKIDKLTIENVLSIRELYKTKKYTQQEIAEKMGCTQQNVSAILLGKVWDMRNNRDWMLKDLDRTNPTT